MRRATSTLMKNCFKDWSQSSVKSLVDLLSSADDFCKQFGPRSGRSVGPDLHQNCLTL